MVALLYVVPSLAVGVTAGYVRSITTGPVHHEALLALAYVCLASLTVPVFLIRRRWAIALVVVSSLNAAIPLVTGVTYAVVHATRVDQWGMADNLILTFGLLWLPCTAISILVYVVLRWVYPTVTGAFCPGCGYSLIGLHEKTCPECGRPFTVEELHITEADLQAEAAALD